MNQPQYCNLYKVKIDSKKRKIASQFMDIYKYIRMDVYKGMDYSMPGQDPISYFFSDEIVDCNKPVSGFNLTGYVETSREIWFHPPRGGDYFRQLELNPYPFLKKKN